MSANDIQYGGTHYKDSEYQHWDWANDCHLHGLTWTGTKYVMRWRKKDGKLDLEKAGHYIDKAKECGVQGSSVNSRHSYFWQFVQANNLMLLEAETIYYMMEGQWERAEWALNRLLAQNPSDRP